MMLEPRLTAMINVAPMMRKLEQTSCMLRDGNCYAGHAANESYHICRCHMVIRA